jgi:hypothetical protein
MLVLDLFEPNSPWPFGLSHLPASPSRLRMVDGGIMIGDLPSCHRFVWLSGATKSSSLTVPPVCGVR